MTGLEADYREMRKALAHGMWKTVHVLAGSILEAVLCDFLISTGYQDKKGLNPTTLELRKIIDACFEEGALSSKSKNLASAVREYRNLIHPGRSIRLQEEVSPGSAKAVDGVLEIAIADVTKKKAAIYGYTAEQIIAKLQSDPAATRLLNRLLDGVRPYELERLLMSVIPQRYEADAVQPVPQVKTALLSIFHLAFDLAPEETKSKVAEFGARIVREKSEATVNEYQDDFFRVSHLHLLSDKERQIVKERLLLRMQTDKSHALFNAVQGIEKFLVGKELVVFLDFLVRCSYWGDTSALKQAAKTAVSSVNTIIPEDELPELWERLSVWEEHFKKHNIPEVAKQIASLRNQLMMAKAIRTFGQGIKPSLNHESPRLRNDEPFYTHSPCRCVLRHVPRSIPQYR